MNGRHFNKVTNIRLCLKMSMKKSDPHITRRWPSIYSQPFHLDSKVLCFIPMKNIWLKMLLNTSWHFISSSWRSHVQYFFQIQIWDVWHITVYTMLMEYWIPFIKTNYLYLQIQFMLCCCKFQNLKQTLFGARFCNSQQACSLVDSF